ncbi:hypothetical protein HYY69_06735 [Candidatus Woesearchaeota archaeon]|nr:hypothetical protein [Candidatus Woesearchaeota archaeon]
MHNVLFNYRLLIVLLSLTLLVSCGDNSEDKAPVKDLKPEPQQVFIPYLSDIFNQNIQVKCLFADKKNNEGVVYAKNRNYHIEVIDPEIGKIITLVTGGRIYSMPLSGTSGTTLNLTALDLSGNNTIPLALNAARHVCFNVSVSDELFKIPSDVAFVDVTDKYLGKTKNSIKNGNTTT